MQNIKIWGIRAGLIGDTIMSLPLLTYLKHQYPDSYVYWVIQKKCSQAASLYIDQKGIDKIHITDGWEWLEERDIEVKQSCDIQFDVTPPVLDKFWCNKHGCVEQVAQMAGYTLKDVVTDKKPRLTKWWVAPDNQHNPNNQGYSKGEYHVPKKGFTVGIMPFAQYLANPHRSPSVGWWNGLCNRLKAYGYHIKHFGWITEPQVEGVTERLTDIAFFEQIKQALECDVVIGTDSGSMWAIGAYSHPAIHIMTYHMPNHYQNPSALLPDNENGTMFFDPQSCDKVPVLDVITKIKEIEEAIK